MSKEQCTHTRVVYRPIGGDGIGWTPRWVCYECGLEFSPLTAKRDELEKFTQAVELKLQMHDSERGDSWRKQSVFWLLNRLQEEVNEVQKAFHKCNPIATATECLDVAAFAMFIYTICTGVEKECEGTANES